MRVTLELFVRDKIDEARILVRKAVVILTPNGGGQQNILGRHRGAPWHVVLADIQPLGVLIEHSQQFRPRR